MVSRLDAGRAHGTYKPKVGADKGVSLWLLQEKELLLGRVQGAVLVKVYTLKGVEGCYML